jgi:hypothetical protein
MVSMTAVIIAMAPVVVSMTLTIFVPILMMPAVVSIAITVMVVDETTGQQRQY